MAIIRDSNDYTGYLTDPGISIMSACASCCANTSDSGWSSTATADATTVAS